MKCTPRPLGLLWRFSRLHSTNTAGSSPVVLRPYQETCLQACLDSLKSGVARIGVSLPTGSGKTTVFTTLIDRLKPPKGNPKAKQALIIVNSIELARQSAAQATRINPKWSVEIEQGAKHQASGRADMYVLNSFAYFIGSKL